MSLLQLEDVSDSGGGGGGGDEATMRPGEGRREKKRKVESGVYTRGHG